MYTVSKAIKRQQQQQQPAIGKESCKVRFFPGFLRGFSGSVEPEKPKIVSARGFFVIEKSKPRNAGRMVASVGHVYRTGMSVFLFSFPRKRALRADRFFIRDDSSLLHPMSHRSGRVKFRGGLAFLPRFRCV